MMNTASALQPAFRAINAQVFSQPSASAPQSIQDVVLHHLRTPAEIEGIAFLRDEIDLSVHTAAGAAFHALEKKETSAGSSSVSSSAESGSAPSGSFRWAIN